MEQKLTHSLIEHLLVPHVDPRRVGELSLPLSALLSTP